MQENAEHIREKREVVIRFCLPATIRGLGVRSGRYGSKRTMHRRRRRSLYLGRFAPSSDFETNGSYVRLWHNPDDART